MTHELLVGTWGRRESSFVDDIVHDLGTVGAKAKGIFDLHIGRFSGSELFLDQAVFVHGYTAERAEEQGRVVLELALEVVVTAIVELMGLVARQTNDLLASAHLFQAERAFTCSLEEFDVEGLAQSS